MIRNYVLAICAAIGLAAAVIMVLEGNRAPAATEPVIQPAKSPFPSNIFGPGIVEASTENIAIGTPVPGIVTAIYVKWGERVEAEEPLFKVDTRDLEAQLLPANAKVNEAAAQLPLAAAKINEARENLAKAENHLSIGESLVQGVSISAEDMANRKFDVEIAKATLASAEAQVDQINCQIASARAQVQQIKEEIQLRIVRAPLSGAILQMKIRPGEYAQTGVLSTPLMLLGNDTILHVRVDIDESDAWRFRPDAPTVAYVRGNANEKTALAYVRTDPDVVPQALLTGDALQRTDTRVLQVIYRFDRSSLPAYVGQLMDVFIEAPPIAGMSGPTPSSPGAADNDATGRGHASAGAERKP